MFSLWLYKKYYQVFGLETLYIEKFLPEGLFGNYKIILKKKSESIESKQKPEI